MNDWYDDEDSWEEDESSEQEGVAMRIDIEAEDALAEKIASVIEARIYSQRSEEFTANVESAVNKKVQEIVAEHAERLVPEALAPIVEKVLREGWKKTDNYGSVTGAESVEDMIRTWFTKKSSNYSNGTTWVNEQIQKHIRDALDKTFGAELAAAKDQFRKRLDGILGEKVTSAMREAAGLR